MELTPLPSPCGAGSSPEAPSLGNQQAHLGSLGTDCYLGSAPGEPLSLAERIPWSRLSVPVSQQGTGDLQRGNGFGSPPSLAALAPPAFSVPV